MSMQAQIKEWAAQAAEAVLEPLFVRIAKLEEYVKAFEQANEVPADPAPRGEGPEVKAAADVRKAPPATGRPSGRPTSTGK
jgi:hypothetical protein